MFKGEECQTKRQYVDATTNNTTPDTFTTATASIATICLRAFR